MKPLYLLILAALLSQVLRPSHSRAEDPLWKGKAEPGWKQANPSILPAQPLWNTPAKITSTASKSNWISQATVHDVRWTRISPLFTTVVPEWKRASAKSETAGQTLEPNDGEVAHHKREGIIVFPTGEAASRSTTQAAELLLPRPSGNLNSPGKP